MKKNSKRNVDPEKWQNELDFPNSPEPIKEPDSQETLELNITPEFAADVEMLDPLEYVDEPIVEAVNNLICDPTRAKLPEHWKWCLTDEDLQQDDPVAYSKITAVRFGVCNDFTFPIKMITVVGGEVFYTVKGVLVTPPNFLPKSFSTVEELTDLLARFDSTNICGGFKLVCKGALTPSMKKETVKQFGERRSKFCSRLLQKGSTCYRCEHLNKLVAGKSPTPSPMERLLDRSQKSTYKNRLLKWQLQRKGKLIKELRQEIKDLRKDMSRDETECGYCNCYEVMVIKAIFRKAEQKNSRCMRYDPEFLLECVLLRIKSKSTYDH
ncbi:hypothetical protein OUZ56_029952 [Daphnia magna]|uniref:CxC3 like cysteine cluster domain-containing protein n=1 Tax=Daphnia magna TaxID=35525 RepID=A0ABR0B892_9CRUS|nr:hypothetical protein OUZ56_029952 [Daphnia magna]